MRRKGSSRFRLQILEKPQITATSPARAPTFANSVGTCSLCGRHAEIWLDVESGMFWSTVFNQLKNLELSKHHSTGMLSKQIGLFVYEKWDTVLIETTTKKPITPSNMQGAGKVTCLRVASTIHARASFTRSLAAVELL